MALDSNIVGGSDTAGKANVDATFNLQVIPPGYNSGGEPVGGGDVNAQASPSTGEAQRN